MSPPPSDTADGSQLLQDAEYTPQERACLLQLAHRAIAANLAGKDLDLTPPSPHLGEQRGAFTTIYVSGRLHGCVGYVLPVYSLYRTIAETAVAAAFHDVRFPPLTVSEIPLLTVGISVLSPLAPITPDQIEIGRHGLVITYGLRRGLLLPQVPVEHGWGRLDFLQQTCLKACCPPDAWERGALIEAFTAEVFCDTCLGP